MATQKDTLLEIIERAIYEEIKACNFYKNLAPQLRFKGSRLKFEIMASTEEKHRDFLIEWYKEINGSPPLLSSDRTKESFVVNTLQKDATLIEILELIIRSEKSAYDYYKNAANLVSNLEEKEIFESLASMEREHMDFFRGELRVISEESIRFAEEDIPWMMEL